MTDYEIRCAARNILDGKATLAAVDPAYRQGVKEQVIRFLDSDCEQELYESRCDTKAALKS